MTEEKSIPPLDLAGKARDILDGKQGRDLLLLDVRGLSSVTDYYLIVSGSSPPHLKALFAEVQRRLKDEGVRCFRKAGLPESGWLVLDYIDVVIHIFSAQARSYYAIEDLWKEAPRVEQE
ncbi:ribosome silencing factor [Verrucomicrobiota bacterium]